MTSIRSATQEPTKAVGQRKGEERDSEKAMRMKLVGRHLQIGITGWREVATNRGSVL